MIYLREYFGLINPKLRVLPLLVGCVCLFALYRLIKAIYSAVSYYNIINKIPGPKSYPFIGNVLSFINLKIEDQPRWIREQSLKYKDGLLRLWFGSEANVMIVAPKHLEHIFSSSLHINKTTRYRFIEPWLGQGLITSNGEKWARDRKLLTPTFHFNILEQFVPIMQECCGVMLNCINKELNANPGKPVDIFDKIIRCTLDVLCKTSLGVHIHVQEEDTEYAHALHRFSELMFYRCLRPWYGNMFLFSLTPSGREHNKLLKIMHDFTKNVIRKRKEWRKENKDQLRTNDMADEKVVRRRKAMLDYLLDMKDNGTLPLTDHEIMEQVDTFMFAGHDTTAAAIAWTLFCLGNNPEHQEKVHQELDKAFGVIKNPPSIKDYAQLTYLNLVLKEALRMFPTVPLIGRILSEDVKLGEYLIPKGTNILISPYVTHRHPDVWTDPDKFDPDRFLPDNIKKMHPYSYIPFSAGSRNCIGQKFAQLEEKIIVASILQKWRVKSVLSHDEVEYTLPVVLRPLGGIHVYLVRKSD